MVSAVEATGRRCHHTRSSQGLRHDYVRRDNGFGHHSKSTFRGDVKAILVGTEPFGCALTPDGAKLYVANFMSDSVSVINTTTDQVIRTIRFTQSGNA